MTIYKHDPAAYSVGDPIYIQEARGWSSWRAVRAVVKKITPSGQIVATLGAGECRINARGSVIGSDRRFVCSEEKALELREEVRIDAVWTVALAAVRDIETACRHKDCDAFAAAIKKAEEAVARLTSPNAAVRAAA